MRIVVIGGVAAGMSAASKAKRMLGDNGVVEVYTREQEISYAACGLPYWVSGKTAEKRMLYARSVERFREQGIEVFLRHEAIKLDVEGKQVLVRGPLGESWVSYDKLILATGSRPFIPPWPGVDLSGIFSLHNVPQADEVREWIARGARKAVIIGGGYIGIEMVEAFKLRGLEVHLVEASDRLASTTLDPDMSDYVREYLESESVTLHFNTRVLEFAGDGVLDRIVTDKGEIAADLALIATGVRPNSELARDAGIELGIRDAIKVNRKMETSAPGIYAAGDCCVDWHVQYQEDMWVPLGTTANKQGRVAGENAAGGEAVFSGIVGTGIMKVMDLEIGRTGTSGRGIDRLGQVADSVVIRARSRAGYYPNPGGGRVKLWFDADDGTIIGAQLVGTEGFAKRVDMFAMAIHAGLTVYDVAGMDLAYAPPFSPLWDPVLIAANAAVKKLRG